MPSKSMNLYNYLLKQDDSDKTDPTNIISKMDQEFITQDILHTVHVSLIVEYIEDNINDQSINILYRNRLCLDLLFRIKKFDQLILLKFKSTRKLFWIFIIFINT
ncbi:unnamed protein product [Adineta steineri]|uniref:Uncharacterized protein n=1 Tax=Adineta steineri TaxID=433720 RepID=A0A813TQF7_9BILA|nr:unnamed protein product [Adineta steineri]CAF4284271.1 unnamed protein product [Adineta steineri]